MDCRYRAALTRGLGTSHSRRQVLTTVAKGTVGGVGAALITRGAVGRAPDRLAAAALAPSGTCAAAADVKVRPNVFDLDDVQIASLRRGVGVMKSRPDTDPTSWRFQANLHADPAIRDPVDTWCQHASWFFFPWHRMYLYRFEQILREAAEDPELTLPYWNYSDNPAHRFLPAALRDPEDADGNPNPLFEPQRERLINEGWGLPDSAVNTGPTFALTNFFHTTGRFASFGGAKTPGPSFFTIVDNFGRAELVPHGPVHVQVGGAGQSFSHSFETPGTVAYHGAHDPAMVGEIVVVDGPATDPIAIDIFDFGFDPPTIEAPVGAVVTWTNTGDFPHTIASDDGTTFESVPLAPVGLMRSLFVSARDPIFWMHHANIDRIWNRWLSPEIGGSNPPESETGWWDQEFTFPRADGISEPIAVRAVRSVYCLGYRYDDDPETEPAVADDPAISGADDATPAADVEPRITELGQNRADAAITLSADPITTVVELEASADATIAALVMGEATPAAGAAPRVVLTLEGLRDRGAPAVTYEVYVNLAPGTEPDFRDPAFVGVINLFGLTGHGNHQQASAQSFDVTPAVRSAEERDDREGEIAVTFVARGLVPPPEMAATPGAEVALAFAEAPTGPWVTIERVTLAAIE